MDEKECYLDKLFFFGMYVGFFFAAYFKQAGLAQREEILPLQSEGVTHKLIN